MEVKRIRQRREYKTFNKRKRDQLEALYNAGVPVKKISEILGYPHQSIYRELKRGYYMHRDTEWHETRKYSADKAQFQADLNATAKGAPLKIGNDHKFAAFVEKMILSGYSPEAVLLYIKENGLEFDTKVCRVTLYSYIENGVFPNISTNNLLRKGSMKNKEKKEKKANMLCKPEHSIERHPSEVSK